MTKKALITGITGQDGSYLAEFLVQKGYNVIGTTTRSLTERFPNLINVRDKIELEQLDIKNAKAIEALIKKVKPDEIYNLASVTTVTSPWSDPLYTTDITGMLPVRILEAIRLYHPQARFFQASSAEMFKATLESPQTETTVFAPDNPYGVAKIFAHAMINLYRSNHKLFAVAGILYTHESARRRLEYVSRKITSTLGRISKGSHEVLELGNLDAKRDWGSAEDYVEAMWTMLQADIPDDFIIATGKSHNVREFVEAAADYLNIKLAWDGKDAEEIAKDQFGKVIVRVNKQFWRPAEKVPLLGSIEKIKKNLNWEPKTSFKALVEKMIESDLKVSQVS